MPFETRGCGPAVFHVKHLAWLEAGTRPPYGPNGASHAPLEKGPLPGHPNPTGVAVGAQRFLHQQREARIDGRHRGWLEPHQRQARHGPSGAAAGFGGFGHHKEAPDPEKRGTALCGLTGGSERPGRDHRASASQFRVSARHLSTRPDHIDPGPETAPIHRLLEEGGPSGGALNQTYPEPGPDRRQHKPRQASAGTQVHKVVPVVEGSPEDSNDYLRKAPGMRNMRIQRTGPDESLTLRLGENPPYKLRR
jgi:hypothetical protein